MGGDTVTLILSFCSAFFAQHLAFITCSLPQVGFNGTNFGLVPSAVTITYGGLPCTNVNLLSNFAVRCKTSPGVGGPYVFTSKFVWIPSIHQLPCFCSHGCRCPIWRGKRHFPL